MDSMESECDASSIHSELSLLEDPPSLGDLPQAACSFAPRAPADPHVSPLSLQWRELHNHSPVCFREGRRASDTSLTQGTQRSLWSSLIGTLIRGRLYL